MKFVTLTFDRDHTHAGQRIKRGEIREIPQYTAEWLIAHDIAHATPSAVRARMPRTTTTSDTHATEEMRHELD